MKIEEKISNLYVLIICSIFIIIITVLFSREIFSLEAQEVNSNLKNYEIIENKNPLNIENILEENISSKIEQELVIDEIDLEYTTEYRNNNTLPQGTIQVLQEGRDGKQNAIIIRKYEAGELISEELVAENLIKASINKVVEIGTGAGINNYKAKVGDTVYVTSNLLSVRLEPNSNSEKLATLEKGTEVKIRKIEGNWLYITSEEQNGYIAIDCITNINPNKPIVAIEDTNKKSGSKQPLSFEMNLNIPSGFTLDEFKKVLSNQPLDKNGVFASNAEYFYYAEKQYNINGIFLAAVGIHESGFGTSAISLNKKNLFGYGAVDSNPSGGAYEFSTYAEGIDLLARVFKKYYINPAGTAIYDGNIANGKFYSGNTISSINVKYASDKNWANCVYKWMQHLYNSL